METLTVHIPDVEKGKALKAVMKALGISFENEKRNGTAVKTKKKEKGYNPEFVAMIEESQKQFEEGRYKVIKTEDLWK